uniref:Uncharacterized protein n=1 Tax=mine drainage metagenome TaxID=410659 RepID=E6Q047_9ZZZZ
MNPSEKVKPAGSKPSVKDDSSANIPSPHASDADHQLLSALAGLDAGHQRQVSAQARRVVLGSAGVLHRQRATSTRSRNLAIAGATLVLLLITPLIWSAVDSLVGDQHLTDTASQLSLLGLIVGSTLFGAVLIAGWWRRRQ